MRPKLHLLLLSIILAGCAAQRAADRGATPEDLARCQTEDCILNYAPIVLKAYPARAEGDRDVLYRVRRAKGPFRPVNRPGMKDLGPPGVWEQVAEPMDGYSSNAAEIVFRVSYREGGRIIQVSVQGGAGARPVPAR